MTNQHNLLVVIQDLSGKESKLTVDPDISVAELKAIYAKEPGALPVKKQRLMRSGKELNDMKSLRKSNVYDRSMLMCLEKSGV